jgi:hypothetical protein
MKVGDYVRFKHLPADCRPSPIRITGVTIRGMLYLEGRAGTFAPKLFVVVEGPKEVA